MKRIFLTSGLVLCMACPAFADLDANGNVSGTSTAADCTEPTLEGTTGSSTFTAQWTDITHTITLNDSSATAYGAPATTNVDPTVLYAEYGNTSPKMYTTRTGAGTTASPYQYSNDITIGNEDVITTNPIGKLITLTIDTGMAYVNTNYNAGTAYATSTSTDTENRPFKGFWATTSTENANELYIDTSGNVTTYGNAAATGSGSAQTWYAHYNCATFTQPSDPSLTGYTFGGWYEDSALTTAVSDWCKDADDTVYAKWTPTTGYSITYDCGVSTDANSTNGTVPAAQTGITYDTAVNLATNTCTYAGRTFAGWKCDYTIEDGTAYSDQTYNYTDGQAGVVFHTTHNVSCSAMWTNNDIGLTWLADTGSGVQDITGNNDSCEYGSTITLPANPTRPGYTFTGWEVVNTPAN